MSSEKYPSHEEDRRPSDADPEPEERRTEKDDADENLPEEIRYWQERFEEDDEDDRHRSKRVKKKGRFRDKDSE